MGRNRKSLLGSGIAPLATVSMCGTHADNLTATGSTQGTALALGADNNVVTTAAASTGVILPATADPSDEVVVANLGANSLSVYPPTGGVINSGSANAAFAVAAGKVATFVARGTAINWIANLSA